MIDFILKILQVYLLISNKSKGDGANGIMGLLGKIFILLALLIAISLLMLVSCEAVAVIYLLNEKNVGYLDSALYVALLNFTLFFLLCFIVRTLTKGVRKK